MTKKELLELLNKTTKETLPYFDLPEQELVKTYGQGKWNIRQVLHHLTDVEYLFIGRYKRIIAEPKQVIWAFNQDDWDKAFDYLNESLDEKKELYQLCRKMNARLIDRYYDALGQKEFVHNETGLRTLKMEFDKLGIHNENHNKQIRMALGL